MTYSIGQRVYHTVLGWGVVEKFGKQPGDDTTQSATVTVRFAAGRKARLVVNSFALRSKPELSAAEQAAATARNKLRLRQLGWFSRLTRRTAAPSIAMASNKRHPSQSG